MLRAILYALRGGFLVRPLAIALVLGATGMLFSEFEEAFPPLDALVPQVLFPSHSDPQVAQVILAGIAKLEGRREPRTTHALILAPTRELAVQIEEVARSLAGTMRLNLTKDPLGTGTDFAIGYERIKQEFGTDFKRVRHENIEKTGRFPAFFGAGAWSKTCLENSQTLDLEGLKGRLLSSSYAPNLGHPRYGAMIEALEGLFQRCQQEGVVRMDYATEVFLGRLE